MKSFRVDILGPNTPGGKLRLFGPEGQVIDQRPYSADEAEKFAQSVRAKYESPAPNLPAIGQQLFRWLDDSARRWLSQADWSIDGLALHLDLHGILADLPWELLHDEVAYCCGLPGRPFTPIRRVANHSAPALAAENRPLRVLFMAS